MKNQEKEWVDARFITPDQLETGTEATNEYLRAQEVPPDQTEPEPESKLPEVAISPRDASRQRKGSKLLYVSLGLLLTAIVGTELYRLLDWSFSLHPIAGGLVSALVALAGGAGFVQLRRSLKGLKQLRQTAQLREQAQALAESHSHGKSAKLLNQLQQLYRDHPQSEQILQSIHEVDSSYNDQEVIRFLSRHALTQQDQRARRCIQRHSVEAGMLVAVSPWASFDMLLAGWRNLRMLNEVMSIYGIAPGASAQIKLVKSVFHNIAFAGLSELAVDAGSTLLGTSLTSGLSARAGQGLGAGLFTARTGLMAMELCRPLPAEGKKQTQMRQVATELIKNLTRSGQADQN